jgi:hypothetical protein
MAILWQLSIAMLLPPAAVPDVTYGNALRREMRNEQAAVVSCP